MTAMKNEDAKFHNAWHSGYNLASNGFDWANPYEPNTIEALGWDSGLLTYKAENSPEGSLEAGQFKYEAAHFYGQASFMLDNDRSPYPVGNVQDEGWHDGWAAAADAAKAKAKATEAAEEPIEEPNNNFDGEGLVDEETKQQMLAPFAARPKSQEAIATIIDFYNKMLADRIDGEFAIVAKLPKTNDVTGLVVFGSGVGYELPKLLHEGATHFTEDLVDELVSEVKKSRGRMNMVLVGTEVIQQLLGLGRDSDDDKGPTLN